MARFCVSAKCMTVGGPDPFKECVFPFKYRGENFTGCIPDLVDQSASFCPTVALKEDEDISNLAHLADSYGLCSKECPKGSKFISIS